MTKEDFFNELKQLDIDTVGYTRLLSTTFKEFMIGNYMTEKATILPLLYSNNWNELRSYCLSRITEIEQKFLAMEPYQSEINAFVNRLYNLKSGFTDYFLKPNTLATWTALKTALETEMLTAGLTQVETDDFVKKFGANGGIKAYNNKKLLYANIVGLLNYSFERHLSLYMYHKSCVVYASYNLIGNNNLTLNYNASSKITSLMNSIINKGNIIYENIKNENINNIINRTSNFNAWLLLKLDTEIIPILAYAHQQRIVENATFTADGKRAMKAGVLLQQSLFSLSICKWIKWTGQWHKELESASALFSAAQTTSNFPIQYTGDEIDISVLSTSPAAYHNKDVIVNGVIQNLNVRHVSPTKVISTAELIDDNGKIVKITLPYIKLDSGGLVNGCYAEISGKFLVSNPEANNQAAISIDRLAIKEMAKTNWMAWLRYQMRTIFEPIAHNLAVSYSAEIGNAGAINPVKYDTIHSKPTIFSINQ